MQLNALKRRVTRCINHALKAIPKTGFKALKNLHKLELLKAKQDSWRNFCAESTKITSWKMYKVCKAGLTRQPVPSLLTLQGGSTTISEKETANTPLQKFFFMMTLLYKTVVNKGTSGRK
jgi:hypothetical protein